MEEIKESQKKRTGSDGKSYGEQTHKRSKSEKKEKKRHISMSNEQLKRICVVVLIGGIAGGIIVGSVVNSARANAAIKTDQKEARQTQKELETQVKELQSELKDAQSGTTLEAVTSDWNMMLVNTDHPLDMAYAPTLVTVGDPADNMQVDERIADSLNKMLEDGKAAGLDMQICSAYRDTTKQKEIFNSTMENWIGQGYSNYDAFEETRKSVQIPGCSEHATGLAVDIISKAYTELDEAQAATPEAQWLAQNCPKYGFILRYPPEKSDATGIIYEPWHYRYVGDEAQAITDSGLTFEEYVEQKAAGTLGTAADSAETDTKNTDTKNTDTKNTDTKNTDKKTSSKNSDKTSSN
ncbi:MAG: M15 family metallopeptidase [Hespellia sp.]|nr:M15 family metallopeptidase [Hespellia sp.]